MSTLQIAVNRVGHMSDTGEYTYVAAVVGDLPPYWQVAEALWGTGVDFDSDGDAAHRNATDWRELTIALRPHCNDRLEIDAMEGSHDMILLRASSQEILRRAVAFLEGTRSIRATGP